MQYEHLISQSGIVLGTPDPAWLDVSRPQHLIQMIICSSSLITSFSFESVTDWKSLFLCSCYLYSIWFSKQFSYWCSNYCIYLLHDVLHSKPLLSRVDLCCIVVCVTSCCLPQGKDDITGEPLIQHDDDKPEALMARLRHYKDVAKPVIDLYKSVDASLSCLHSLFITVIFLHAANNVSSCCQPIKIRLKLY